MQVIPLIFGSGKSARSEADTDLGKLILKRDLSQINTIRTQGTVSAELQTDEGDAKVSVKRKGDGYVGTWEVAGEPTKTLPQNVACQAYETVRHLAGKRLGVDDIEAMVALIAAPTEVPVTDKTCKALQPGQ